MNKSKLISLMEKKGLTPEALAAKLGLSVFTIRNILRGQTPPKRTVMAMCTVLECQMGDLLYPDELRAMEAPRAERTTA